MMAQRDLSFLTSPPPTSDEPGLATVDPRFSRITRMAESGEHSAAADAVEALMREGIFDIRLIVILLYATFAEEGLPRLGPMLAQLHVLLETHGDRLGPVHRGPAHLKKSLVSFIDRLEQSLSYHREKRDAVWSQWSAHDLETALDAVQGLLHGVDADLQEALDEPASRLLRVLRDARADAPSAHEEKDAVDVTPTPSSDRAATEAARTSSSVELRASPKLQALQKKLEAFELLVRRGDFRKVAMVAADIQSIIEDFDPREYFPEMFASFGGLLSEHVDSVAPYWEQRDTLSWRMLEQFYRVDLEGFVGEDGERGE